MNKCEAEREFRAVVLPAVRRQYERDGVIDWPARREAWNNWTSLLQEGGHITLRQYDDWTQPRCVRGPES